MPLLTALAGVFRVFTQAGSDTAVQASEVQEQTGAWLPDVAGLSYRLPACVLSTRSSRMILTLSGA